MTQSKKDASTDNRGTETPESMHDLIGKEKSASATVSRALAEKPGQGAPRQDTSEHFLKELHGYSHAESPVTIHTEKGWAERARQKDKNGAEIKR